MTPAAPIALGALAQTTPEPGPGTLEQLTGAALACGDEPSWACEVVYDWTGSDTWAGVADWIVAKPLAIGLTILVAWIANRIARYLIKRSITRLTAPARSERLHRFADISSVEGFLDELVERGLVTKLPRAPGAREGRWAQLLTGAPPSSPEPVQPPAEGELAQLRGRRLCGLVTGIGPVEGRNALVEGVKIRAQRGDITAGR